MINISDYKLIQPTRIKKIKKTKVMYDITVKDDHTFFVYLDENNSVLTHNCDGQHITALIINFFHKWFPHVIKHNRLFRLITPLVVCTYNGERKYFNTLDEYTKFIETHKVSNVNYLKGLGSLSEDDWSYVMKNKMLFSISDDRSASKFMEIAFGESVLLRKRWLEGK